MVNDFSYLIAAHVGGHGWGLPGLAPISILSGTLASYGASAVARTSGRGRVPVAEV
jgi:hypothetical protein